MYLRKLIKVYSCPAFENVEWEASAVIHPVGDWESPSVCPCSWLKSEVTVVIQGKTLFLETQGIQQNESNSMIFLRCYTLRRSPPRLRLNMLLHANQT